MNRQFLKNTIHFRVSDNLNHLLAELSAKTNRTESSLVREAVAAYVTHYSNAPEKIARGLL